MYLSDKSSGHVGNDCNPRITQIISCVNSSYSIVIFSLVPIYIYLLIVVIVRGPHGRLVKNQMSYPL